MTGLRGRLLVATPLIAEPTFRRTVVLLLEDNEEGSLGLVINRPLQVEVSSVLPLWQPYASMPGRLFQGGPVQTDSALGLVAVAGNDLEEPLGIRRISGSFGLVDLDTPPELVGGAVTGLRVFAGYAGWSTGQLEGEIKSGSWYVVDCESRDPFTDQPVGLWRHVLRRQRGDLALMSTYPDDPSMN